MTSKPVVWLTAKEAANHARVSVWTIRQAVKDGELPSYQVRGRGYRFKQTDVDAWLESQPFEPGQSA